MGSIMQRISPFSQRYCFHHSFCKLTILHRDHAMTLKALITGILVLLHSLTLNRKTSTSVFRLAVIMWHVGWVAALNLPSSHLETSHNLLSTLQAPHETDRYNTWKTFQRRSDLLFLFSLLCTFHKDLSPWCRS